MSKSHGNTELTGLDNDDHDDDVDNDDDDVDDEVLLKIRQASAAPDSRMPGVQIADRPKCYNCNPTSFYGRIYTYIYNFISSDCLALENRQPHATSAKSRKTK